MRTTLDIDDPILKELKKLGEKEGKSLGRIISDLLAQALQRQKKARPDFEKPTWISKNMNARINLEDKEALYAVLDKSNASGSKSGIS